MYDSVADQHGLFFNEKTRQTRKDRCKDIIGVVRCKFQTSWTTVLLSGNTKPPWNVLKADSYHGLSVCLYDAVKLWVQIRQEVKPDWSKSMGKRISDLHAISDVWCHITNL